jgi:hypothetical protein
VQAVSSLSAAKSENNHSDLVTALSIPVHLTNSSTPGLCAAYLRWKGYQEAHARLDRMVADGSWKGPQPTLGEIACCFVKHSTWHQNYKPNFKSISDYPDMVRWLDQTDDAPTDMELWGYAKDRYGFDDLRKYFARIQAKQQGGSGQKRKASVEEKKSHKKVKGSRQCRVLYFD